MRVCGRSTLPEPIRDRAHNPCQSVDCPNCGNQSETKHSTQVIILRGFHHIQWVNLNHLTTIMADRYMNIPLNQPSFNWDSTNMIAEWKRFHDQVELLLDQGTLHWHGRKAESQLHYSTGWLTKVKRSTRNNLYSLLKNLTRRTKRNWMMSLRFLRYTLHHSSQWSTAGTT